MSSITPEIQVIICDERFKDGTFPLPRYETEGSAGMDLRAMINEPLVLKPNECQLISSGLKFFIADPDYFGQIVPRSGTGHKRGLILGNLTGVIDSDYQGVTHISLWNRSEVEQVIEPGERIAQFIVSPVVQAALNIVDEFDGVTERGAGGFGSTGTQHSKTGGNSNIWNVMDIYYPMTILNVYQTSETTMAVWVKTASGESVQKFDQLLDWSFGVGDHVDFQLNNPRAVVVKYPKKIKDKIVGVEMIKSIRHSSSEDPWVHEVLIGETDVVVMYLGINPRAEVGNTVYRLASGMYLTESQLENRLHHGSIDPESKYFSSPKSAGQEIRLTEPKLEHPYQDRIINLFQTSETTMTISTLRCDIEGFPMDWSIGTGDIIKVNGKDSVVTHHAVEKDCVLKSLEASSVVQQPNGLTLITVEGHGSCEIYAPNTKKGDTLYLLSSGNILTDLQAKKRALALSLIVKPETEL